MNEIKCACKCGMAFHTVQAAKEFPIGEIRQRLFVDGSSEWNSIVRDKTAELELIWVKLVREEK